MDPNTELPKYWRWLHYIVAEKYGFAQSNPNHDDLVQEGWLAMYRALRSYDDSKGALPTYLTQAAKWQIQTCLRDRKWTGQETRRGQPRDDREQPTAYLADLLQEPQAPEKLLDDYAEVHSAVRELPDDGRRYAYRRFWLQESDPEITAAEGFNLGPRWRREYRDILAGRLSHLRR